ncbi:hypothetical protein G6F56_004418 [Rhizopus delemar]|nr:hypothetical protein G6F56_004418 [Rhizopus delemar]
MPYEEPDAMEFEYTHPQTHFNTNSFLSSQPCFQKQSPFISAQLFSKSMFDTQETTDSVCSLLDTFNLSEKEELKPELKTVPKNNPPKSPPPITKEVSVEPTVTPTSVHHQHAYNHHTPTFIYNQAPIPTIDPLAERHSTLYYIMGLIKIGFTSITFSFILYLFFEFVQFVRQDVAAKIIEYESNEFNGQIFCQREYEVNQCAHNTRLPALAGLCQDLENCMFRPFSTSKSRVLAETLAEIANGFSDNITLKTTCLSVIILVGLIWSITSVLTRPKEKTQDIQRIQEKIENKGNRLLLE